MNLEAPSGTLTSTYGSPSAQMFRCSEVPATRSAAGAGRRTTLFIVRPRRSVSLPAVAGQLKQILRRLAREEPAFDSDARLVAAEPRLTPELGLSPDVRPRVESAIRLLSGVVALVLLIACANVANLLLFRNVVKRSTVTTRMALGASPARIAREHLVQSLLLGVVGSIVGMGVGWLISRVFQGQTLGSTPAFGELPLDRRVVLFAAVASIGTALAFGTVPAALAGRFDLAAALRQTDTRHSRRMAALRSALSAGQLALTLTLGVGALLLVRTMHKLDRASTGLDFHGVVSVYQSHRVNMDRPQTDVLARRVLAAVQAVDERSRCGARAAGSRRALRREDAGRARGRGAPGSESMRASSR